MAGILRLGVVARNLLILAVGGAAMAAAAGGGKGGADDAKPALDALLTRLNDINRDAEMTTAKRSLVAAAEIEKFNRQCQGKPLRVRFKVQDVVSGPQGRCLKVDHPDLEGVQSRSLKFTSNLSDAEVMAVTKESVLVVSGAVSAGNQPQRSRSDVVKPGGSIAFSLRGSQTGRICLDNVSYQLEAAPKRQTAAGTRPYNGVRPDGNIKPDSGIRPDSGAKPDSGDSPAADDGEPLLGAGKAKPPRPTHADKAKNEQLRSVDDVKAFFLKGMAQSQRQPGSKIGGSGSSAGLGSTGRTGAGAGSTGRSGSGSSPGNTGSGSSSAKSRHNHIYTAAEIIQKFGNPSSRASTTTTEKWTYKCKDGVVRVTFAPVGYFGGSASKPERLRLEVKAVDAASAGGRLRD